MKPIRIVLLAAWRRMAWRDRQALGALVLVSAATVAFVGLWQPAQARLAAAERLYQQRLALAAEINRAPPPAQANDPRPLSVSMSERAQADGLDVQQLEVQDDTLRLTLSGDARALLTWLHCTEQNGAILQSLILDTRGERLEAQLVVRAPAHR
ncbi:general secretion pathway protein M [Pseudomonas sp. ok272]|uniref:type II secretion system protein GspM n=1 Tax=unclassified Pseudomonas TaxID=196821 RepID=UPI0008B76918|nr:MULTISPECIES: type II secretion system protein GspM [unclassified Pseudomonas]SEN33870.1 general secretion pathway protein M [Pseudomonas sp. ok272]SFM84827.1 general secretion pathway protein M [Pseudomonas sp. ok602]